MSRRSLRARWAVVLVASLLIAASCGNSDDDDDTAADGGTETTAAPDTTVAPTDGGTETTVAPTDGGTDTTTTAATDGGEASGEFVDGVDDTERDTFVPIEGVPGVTDEQIGFAAFGTNSNNPLGTCVLDCYVDGIEAYFAYRNSQGGVYGRDLVLVDALDDELANNLPRAQEIIASDSYFGAFSATQVASGWTALDDAGVPLWTWSIHAESTGREGIWGYSGANCYDCTQRVVPYLVQRSGSQVVASLGYGISENSKLCAAAVANSVEAYSDEIGATVGYFNDNIAFGLPNGIGPEVTAMLDAGVDFISTCIDLNGMRTLAEELQRQGGDDVILYHPNTYNQSFVAENADLFEGDYVGVGFVPFEYDTGLELQQAFIEWMGETGSELSELAMFGWINAHEAYNGLLLAGPEFDRQSVIDGRNTLTAESIGGLINPIDWTRQHNAPSEGDPTNDYVSECFSVVQIVGGEFQPITSDETKPFLCWSNENTDFGEPVETSFG